MTGKLRSILAAVDLSPASDPVLRASAELSRWTGAELRLVHVLEPQAGDVLEMQRRVHAARAAVRSRWDAVVPPGTPPVAVLVETGRPSSAILSAIARGGSDLVVIGPHRPRPFGDQVLGTTADQLLRRAVVPCLVVRGPLTIPPSRIMVASDLSHAAHGALNEALRLAPALRGSEPDTPASRLIVLHVDQTPAANPTAAWRRHAKRIDLDRQIGDALRRTRCETPLRIERAVLNGPDPATEIVRHAHRTMVDLVVMGTHGDPPLVKALLGSVSAAVARSLVVPLLLVPARGIARAGLSAEVDGSRSSTAPGETAPWIPAE